MTEQLTHILIESLPLLESITSTQAGLTFLLLATPTELSFSHFYAICHTGSDCLPVGLLHQPGSNSEAGSYPPTVLRLSTDSDLETVLGKAHLVALPLGPSHTRKVPSRQTVTVEFLPWQANT